MTITRATLPPILERIKLPFGWQIECLAADYLTIRIHDPNGKDNVTGEPLAWKGRKWLLSEHMTVSEVVQTVFLATMTALEHETREQFLYKGQPVLDPHFDVEQLYLLRHAGALDKREEPPFLEDVFPRHTAMALHKAMDRG